MFKCPGCAKEYESLRGGMHHWRKYCPKRLKEPPSIENFDYLAREEKRKFLLAQSNNSCSECGFSRTRPDGRGILEIDHIDGNHTNNTYANLRVLCPNCHALTPNFRNFGRSRKARSSTRLRKGNVGFVSAADRRNNILPE